MVPKTTPTRARSRSHQVTTTTPTSVGTKSRTPRSTRAQARQSLEQAPSDPAGSPNGKNGAGTGSARQLKTSTPKSARKRKADEMNGIEPSASHSLSASDMIVVEASTRSSGRARKKSTKLVEEEEWAEQKKVGPSAKTKSTVTDALDMNAIQADQADLDQEPVVEEEETRPTNEATVPNATPSKKRGRPKGSKNTVKPKPTTDPTETTVQPAPPVDLADPPLKDAEPLPDTTTPATTPRKRGRPKGSKNRKSLNAAGDPPFEDISIDPSAKSRKLPHLAKLAVTLADAVDDRELEELIANNQEPTTDQLQPDLTQDPDADLPAHADEEKHPALDELGKLLQKSTHVNNFEKLRNEILLRLSGNRPTPLVGVSREYEQVHSLLEQTVAAGEGNSMLVIGNRGLGKTALVETALASISRLHPDDFYVIRLTGFIHTDDKLALREIWRQLGRAMELQDPGQATRNNYADTLASLLAVLSHPAEIAGDAASAQTSKSVVFILDEFDLFASHPRQTLLYNLLDIAQSRKAPIAVLGLTTKIDVTEMLEKRVKSRFSHRYVYLQLPRNYTTFLAIIQAALYCDTDPEFAPPADAHTTTALSADKHLAALLKAWTAHVATALRTEPLSNELQRIYATSKSVPFVLTGLIPAVSSCSAALPPTASVLASHLSTLSPPDSKLTLLPSLSDAQLALLVAAARCDVLLASDAVNFLLAYDEYVRCTTRARVAAGLSTGTARGSGGSGAANPPLAAAAPGMPRVWSREVCLAAWEGLTNKSLLVPVLGTDQGMGGRLAGAAGGAGDAGKRGRLWRVDVSLEEIGRAIQGWSGAAREIHRWCRNL